MKSINRNKFVVITFIVVMILFPIVSFMMSNLQQSVQNAYEDNFNGYGYVILTKFVINIISAVFVLVTIWTVREMMKYNIRSGILPLIVTVCIELVQCMMFVSVGEVLINLTTIINLPNYMIGITIIMLYTIINFISGNKTK